MSESTTDKDTVGTHRDGHGAPADAPDRLAGLRLDDLDDDRAARGAGSGLSWLKVAVLGLALTFLGFAVGVFVSRDSSPGASSVDVGFYQDMLSHHEQALEMATVELGKGTVTEVRSLAMEVLNFQAYEIGYMDRTLRDWGYSRGNRPDTAMEWMGMPTPVDEMPGIASDEQMDELRAAEGEDVDALFLELMAEHHLGGLHMAEYAADHAEDGDVRTWAQRMARNQAIEINEYAATAERTGLPVVIDRVEVPAEVPAEG